MENKTKFDLNAAVTRWRDTLAAHDAFDPEKARELESHLRDGIQTWINKGATEPEAFHLASTRLGPPAAIADQFEIEDPLSTWRRRFFWMLIGILSLRLLSDAADIFASATSALLIALGVGSDIALHELFMDGDDTTFFTIGQTLALGIAPVALYFLSKRFHTPKGAPWKRPLTWLAASRPRLILICILAITATAYANSTAAHWRADFLRAQILSTFNITGPLEIDPAKLPTKPLPTQLLHPLLLILLLATVMPTAAPRKKNGMDGP